jgi:hypothetical protein
MREAARKAGLLPYFDTENFEVLTESYVYKGHPMLFVVNDKREPYDKGRPNEVEILVRDRSDGLRVIEIDSGDDMTLARHKEGWTFRDTVPPSWYRIYAVVKPGQAYQGPPPLGPGPAVLAFAARRDPAEGAVVLNWKLPFEDWVGCDVQWYRIFRGEAGAESKLIEEIYGRVPEDAGGVVTEYRDRTAEAGKTYTYRVQIITPLRREGPLSDPATVRP